MMLVLSAITWLAPRAGSSASSPAIPAVIAVGEEYLRIVVAWNFVASGVIFVSSSMFQAMGNTMPSLVTSVVRIIIITMPVLCWPHSRASR